MVRPLDANIAYFPDDKGKLRIGPFGDVLDPHNEDAACAIANGNLEVKRDESGKIIWARLTQKYTENRSSSFDPDYARRATQQHLAHEAMIYFGEKGGKGMTIDKEEYFFEFLKKYLGEDPFVEHWEARRIRKGKSDPKGPENYRLEILFCDKKQKQVFIGHPRELVEKVDAALRAYNGLPPRNVKVESL